MPCRVRRSCRRCGCRERQPRLYGFSFLSVLVDEVAELLRLTTSYFREVRAFRGEDDATRRVDDHAISATIFTRGNGFLYITTLRANARNEYRHIANESADFAEFIGIGCADYKRAVTILVPLARHATRNETIERLAVHGQVLKLPRAWIGSATKYDDTFLRSREERLKCFGSKIRMNRDSVRLKKAERRVHITSIGVADVRPLGVENHRNIRRDGVNVRDGSL